MARRVQMLVSKDEFETVQENVDITVNLVDLSYSDTIGMLESDMLFNSSKADNIERDIQELIE